MASTNLVKWGGILALIAGLACIGLGLFIGPMGALQLVDVGLWPFGTLLGLAYALGRLGGIAGIHAVQRERYGRLGAAGAVVASIGVAIELVVAMVGALVIGRSGPWEQVFMFLGLLGLSVLVGWVGLVLLGVATLRNVGAQLLPRWVGVGVLLIFGLPVAWLLMIFEPPGAAVGDYASGIAYGVFWMLVGYVLLSSRYRAPGDANGASTRG